MEYIFLGLLCCAIIILWVMLNTLNERINDLEKFVMQNASTNVTIHENFLKMFKMMGMNQND